MGTNAGWYASSSGTLQLLFIALSIRMTKLLRKPHAIILDWSIISGSLQNIFRVKSHALAL